MAEEKDNQPRRPDLKGVLIGGSISAALLALTPLNEYIDRSQKPIEVEMRAMKEVQAAKLETVGVKLSALQSTADDIKRAVQEQVRAAQELQLRVQNLEFIVQTKPKGK